MTETEMAVEWLETRDPYMEDIWVNPMVNPDDEGYTDYFASFKDDTCNGDKATTREFWCSLCQRTFPKFIQSIDWTPKDDEMWMKRGNDQGWYDNLYGLIEQERTLHGGYGFKVPEYVQ